MQQRAPSFGRKGHGSDEPERRPISFGKAGDASDMDRRREEFIAAERARRQQEGSFEPPVETDSLPRRPYVQKSISTAYILWFVTGAFAGHRFYLGSMSIAFAQICLRLVGIMMFLSGDGFGLYLIAAAFLWLLADAVMLPEMTRKANARAEAIASGRVFA
jgi:hypothetical protein